MKKINGEKQEKMISDCTTKKITDLVRVIEDQKLIIADLKKELAGYKQSTGEMD